MGKRIFALVLAAIMAFTVCGCGKSNSGDTQDSGEQSNVGQVVSNEGFADDAGADVIDDRGRVLWGNVTDDDTVTIYLKDEAVNRMEEDEDGEVINAIEVEFFSDDGTVVLRCTLTVNGTEANIFDGDLVVAATGAAAKDEYVNDVVSWKVQSAGIVAILKDCDSASAVFRDYQGESGRRIFDASGIVEVAALFEEGEDALQGEGDVQLGFDEDYVFVKFSGEAYQNPEDIYSLKLSLGTDEPSWPYSIRFQFREDSQNVEIAGYQYEADGVVTGPGLGYSTNPKFIWSEDDGAQFAAWFYAPGFREALGDIVKYSLTYETDPNLPGEYLCEGEIGEILGAYEGYGASIPALPTEYLVDGKGADSEYFTPLTPYYSVIRYDYPAVPVTVNFRWGITRSYSDGTHQYAYMSLDTDLISATKLVLISYDIEGNPVQENVKLIYPDETSAIHAHIMRHDALRIAEGETYGTEADFTEWRYERFRENLGRNRFAQEGNVVYVSGSDRFISEADDMFSEDYETEYRLISSPGTESGSFPYSYNYGNASSETGESVCSYRSYCSFDTGAVMGKS